MSCYHPISGYRTADGTLRLPGPPGGFGLEPLKVACGSCIGCHMDKSKEWAIRAHHETVMNPIACNLTLTYDPDCLPDNGSLDHRNFELFMKLLRKRLGKRKVRYLQAGEYGEAATRRPHHHVCLWGEDFTIDREYWKPSGSGHALYRSEFLQTVWPHGFATIQRLSFENAAYTARYCLKKAKDYLATEAMTERVDPISGEIYYVLPEYMTMSKNPGLGSDWYDKYSEDLWHNDFVVINDKKYPVPKFYDAKLAITDPERLGRIKAERRKRAESDAVAVHNSPERLQVREAIQEARISRLHRPFS